MPAAGNRKARACRLEREPLPRRHCDQVHRAGLPNIRRWLGRAVKDGRLLQMATADGQLWAIVGEMIGKKANAPTGMNI